MLKLLLFLSLYAPAKTIKVAVLDSGLPFNYKQLKICEAVDFTDTWIMDDFGHGTNVSNLIENNSGGAKYCQIVLKVFTSQKANYSDATIRALKYLLKKDVDIINYSAGGLVPDSHEKYLFDVLIKRGVKIVVAAGNESMNLDKDCGYYPACYGNLIVVGNGSKPENKAWTSNFGSIVTDWEVGNNQMAGNVRMSGTSQSTAIKTGKLIKRKLQSIEEPSNKSEYEEAAKVTAEQVYVNNKIDVMVKVKIEYYKARVPVKYQNLIANIYPIIDILIKGKLEIQREF